MQKFKMVNCELTQMKNLPLLSLGMLEEPDWIEVEKELRKEMQGILRQRGIDEREIQRWL